MRFGIRDLLLTTTVVAIYAAGFAYLSRLEGHLLPRGELAAALFVVGSMAVTTFFLAWRSWQRAGGPLVSWRLPNWWAPHAGFLLVFACYLGYCTSRGQASGIIYPLIIAFQQFAFLFNGWFSLSQNGVCLGLQFISWDECKLRLVEEGTHLEYSVRGRLLPPRPALKKHRVAVPAEKLEEVRAILADRLAPEREPPMDADQRR